MDRYIGPFQVLVSAFLVDSSPPEPGGHSSSPPPCADSAASATVAASAVDAATEAVAEALRKCHAVLQKGGPSSTNDFKQWIESNCGPELDFETALKNVIRNRKLLIGM